MSRLSIAIVNVSPLTRISLRASLIVRLIIKVFSFGSPSSSITVRISELSVSKTASTDARFSPKRIKDLSARQPSTKLKASIIIDLPAPVSPDKILSPLPRLKLHSSINAMFFILRARSILEHRPHSFRDKRRHLDAVGDDYHGIVTRDCTENSVD